MPNTRKNTRFPQLTDFQGNKYEPDIGQFYATHSNFTGYKPNKFARNYVDSNEIARQRIALQRYNKRVSQSNRFKGFTNKRKTGGKGRKHRKTAKKHCNWW
jgi:hypothetical protein